MILEELKQLPVADRLHLVEELWDSLVDEDADISLSNRQLEEVDRRRAEMLANPEIGIPWAEAKARLLSAEQ